MNTRRTVLQILAAAPALAATGCENTSGLPDPAAPWRDPGVGETDPRRFALAHAILAPNPHNMQPWLVELSGDTDMTLYCDLDRRLPATDPFDRQITLGCGAFIYLYCIALWSRGAGYELELFPEGAPEVGARLDQRPLARVRMSGVASVGVWETFFAQITARRTNRNPYEHQMPPADALEAVADAAGQWLMESALAVRVVTDEERVSRVRDIAWRAWDKELNTPAAWEETVNVLRIGKREIAEHRDGIALDGGMIPFAKAVGLLSRANMLNPKSGANEQARTDWKRMIDSAPAFIWLASADDAPQTRMLAGMAYARLNLAAAAHGLAIHPWSQALQEYPEMKPLYDEMRETLGIGGQTLQMLVRVGKAPDAQPAPRRDPASFIKT